MTKRELAERSTGDDAGGERSGDSPPGNPEQFEEFTDDGAGERRAPR